MVSLELTWTRLEKLCWRFKGQWWRCHFASLRKRTFYLTLQRWRVLPLTNWSRSLSPHNDIDRKQLLWRCCFCFQENSIIVLIVWVSLQSFPFYKVFLMYICTRKLVKNNQQPIPHVCSTVAIIVELLYCIKVITRSHLVDTHGCLHSGFEVAWPRRAGRGKIWGRGYAWERG